MSQHTIAKRSIISRRNGRLVVAGVPLPLAITLLGVGGVALAAVVLLTTTISGKATVRTVGTSNAITVSATSADGSALDCKDLKVGPDAKTITFNPVLTKTINGGNSGTTPVTGGECTITLTVENTGTNPIQVDRSSRITVPAGWQITPLSGDALSPIQPKGKATLVAKLTATEAAQDGGTFGGQIVYTDATSATP